MNSQVFLVGQIIISLLLIGAILLQAQGSGLGSTWAGGGESYHTKRGVEKILFRATIVLIALFFPRLIGNFSTSLSYEWNTAGILVR